MTGPMAGEVLRNLGMTGILTEPPEKGGIAYLLCDMDVCYCPRGRGYFEPMSRDLEWAAYVLDANRGALAEGSSSWRSKN